MKEFYSGENETYLLEKYRLPHQYSRSIVEQVIRFDHDDATVVLTALVAEFGTLLGESLIRQTVGRLKPAATRNLKTRYPDWKRIWARNCHMSSIIGDEEYHDGLHEIDRHWEQRTLIHVWKAS